MNNGAATMLNEPFKFKSSVDVTSVQTEADDPDTDPVNRQIIAD